MQKQRFIQIGQTAARDPATGEFLQTVPLFAEITPEIEAAQAATVTDVARLFAGKMKQYIDGGGIVENRAAGRHSNGNGA